MSGGYELDKPRRWIATIWTNNGAAAAAQQLRFLSPVGLNVHWRRSLRNLLKSLKSNATGVLNVILESDQRHLPTIASMFICLALSGGVFAAETETETEVPEDIATPADGAEMLHGDSGGIDEKLATQSGDDTESVADYERSIEQLMSDYGVYDDRLSEELYGMGLALRSQGNHSQAIDSFERSLHVSKVNDGLHHLQQVPLLELLIESNTAIKNWERVDGYYQYLYWLHARVYGVDDPALIPVLQRVGRWHLQAAGLDTGRYPLLHLHEAAGAYGRAVELGELAYGQNDTRLLDSLYGFALASYYRAVAAQSGDISRAGGASRYYRRGAFTRDDMIMRGYRDGKNALNRMAEIHASSAETPPEARGIALTLLGDWYLLFGRRQSAQQAYTDAYSALTTSGIAAANIQQFFAQPKALPTLRVPAAPTVAGVEKEPAEMRRFAVASFDVTSSGKARNIQIVESQPADDSSLRRRVRRAIRSMRFRPRMENGQAVASTTVSLRYVIAN